MDIKTLACRIMFTAAKRQRFWQLLHSLIASGLEANQALALLARVYARSDGLVAHICRDLRSGLRTGSFVEVARKYLPESEALLFEQWGSTEARTVLRAAIRTAKNESRITGCIRTAMLTPAAIFIVLLVFLTVLGRDFYPVLGDVIPREELDFPNRALWAISTGFANNLLLIGVVCVCSVIAYQMAQYYLTGPIRDVLDRFPPFTLFRFKTGSGFAVVLSEHAKVGNTINSDWMYLIARGRARYFRTCVERIGANLRQMSLGDSIMRANANWPDPEINLVLQALSDRPGWARDFDGYLDNWMEQVEYKVRAAMRLLNMILLAAMAAIMGVAATTIFSITSLIQ